MISMLGFARPARNVKGEEAEGLCQGSRGELCFISLACRLDERGTMHRSGLFGHLLEQARLGLAPRDALLVARRMERNVERRAESRLHADDARLVALRLDLE